MFLKEASPSANAHIASLLDLVLPFLVLNIANLILQVIEELLIYRKVPRTRHFRIEVQVEQWLPNPFCHFVFEFYVDTLSLPFSFFI